MCGICGVVSLDVEKPVEEGVVVSMCRMMIHRGPDDDGYFIEGGVGLGMRRLSIIDLAGGRQPIHNEDESLWIVFNGEIYNFPEMKTFLEKLGHRFYTRSDTEVIVHAYEEFGEECVKHLNGMFAFAIWDKKHRKLFVARDRTGIKPLHYTLAKGQLIFGSELKAILVHPDVERRIDLVALNEYLSFEYVPTPRTIFKNIKKLPPGHTLTFSERGLSLQEYWNISFARSESRPPVNPAEYEARLRECLKESVKKEMISDVPIGVLLSGGIDSSAVAAMMSQLSPGKVKSFSIGFADASFDESSHARLVAEHLGTEHHELILTPEIMLDLVPCLPDFLDEPLGDSSIIPTYLLSRFTREHVKVALGGDGGDELFAGYPTLQAHRLVEYYERLLPWFVRARIVPCLVKALPVSFDNISFDFKVRRFIAGRGVPFEIRHHRWLGSFTDEGKKQLFLPWVTLAELDTYEVARRHLQECDAHQALNQLLYCDMKLYLEGDILVKVDRASMACSLETRVPLLNNAFVEFMMTLPVDLKLRRLTSKYIFKKSLANLLPRQIINRKKKGFNIPVAKWINQDLKGLVLDMLSQARIERAGLFNYDYIQKLLADHFDQRTDNRKLIWTLLVFELWYERYMEGNLFKTPTTRLSNLSLVSEKL